MKREDLIGVFKDMARIGREKGLPALSPFIAKLDDDLAKLGTDLTVKGVAPDLLEKILRERKVQHLAEEDRKADLIISAILEINRGTVSDLLSTYLEGYL